uniref:RPN2_C domain-containing protein n=1 Tax=Angiostrongylus cantonensis TaxID=6313 RepID=A0A0K0CVL3_ANGCA
MLDVGDALAFDRDQDAFKPPMLLPAKELLGKLAEKAQIAFHGEDADLHPDDRGNDDDYVNEVPDVNEKDYKENKQF